ncbi:tryptophan synthase beta chain [Arthrobacter stackebrandtii]|uniref:Tryptophan synthase beta chain n=1 Tax=Arthrobacter stackebrandtii TaxID=272161 RepID=A0ABS4Z1C4_9MICC|nr:tryptophan synthase subunit beta [Arthrobacter stackebrandtii]MBP2414856.1 tryptophan synthase beta chain [Arthrobacter stackebrandtii]PYG98782.1 tryptophan synthase subunit beta [Arthrobacter stackebrandtii]
MADMPAASSQDPADMVDPATAFLQGGAPADPDVEHSLRHAPGPYFGSYGGRWMPESLIAALDELEDTFEKAKVDPEFLAEIAELNKNYSGRPSLLTEAKRFSEHAGGARVFLKREDLNHTGSHKINNVLGQALLAKRMGKTRVIAETGAGQHGVASATAAALLGLECVVYMGAEDCRRQALNVARMQLLGATVVPVTNGSQTLKDAINDALRDWVANVENTHYLLGTAAGAHPFPAMVRFFHEVIGEEARGQIIEQIGRLPDAVCACIGGGSNAIGLFHGFLDDPSVKIYGFEAGGDGVDTGRHAATITLGRPGVLHGARSYLMQDDDGQTIESHSISAGLDYPGVGPEHAYLNDIGRVTYEPITDAEAMDAFKLLCRTEGIIPAIESSHALAGALKVGRRLTEGTSTPSDKVIIVNLSGRGDKDVQTAADWFGLLDEDGNVKGTMLSTRSAKGAAHGAGATEDMDINAEDASNE